MADPARYPLHRDEDNVAASPDLPALEREVLDHWEVDGTFQASIDQRDAGENGENEFVFYDGPPFANGLPHYGHLLTGYAKDVVPRYQTMRGRRVERRFGWDTHGLPAELEAMNQLGIKTKDEIVELGIDTFNAACRSSVMKYTDEWRAYVTRQARWVDFENDYKTLDPTFMESVIWAFKSLYDKGLIYEDFRVLPYCWNDQTPLSNHELRMDDDVYQNRQDPAVTVGFDVVSGSADGAVRPGDKLLIWTTTPWTLPSNLLVMVGPDIDYAVVEAAGSRYVVAEARLAAYARELVEEGAEEPRVVARLTGRDLLGVAYTPPFSYYAGRERAHRVVEADFVTTTDGTGLVHSAGAFGEDDKIVCDREGVESVMPVGADGRFTHPVDEYAGLQVFDANLPIIDHLKARTRGAGDDEAGSVTAGTVLLRRESYDHSYPHCWRCRQPLIYMGVSSWFVEVTKFKDRMVELNKDIAWVPEHIQEGQFGKWLAGARDWSITRNRFWGSPVPVWKSDNPEYPRIDVYGSFEELERDFGRLPRDPANPDVPDLHRPFVDELTRPNPDDPTGRSTMRRVEDVLDVWFDSGSMPYAQVHYPFDNTEWFEHHYPGDFIVEYIGQTRGWFYTLHILATALFDRPAFQTALSHGIVLGSDGRKMSKSLRNYPDVNEVFDRDGSDAMRWFLMASPILRGGNLVVTEEGIRDAVRQVLLPLWSTYYFFTLYANSVKGSGDAASADAGRGRIARNLDPERVARLGVMDRYLLARTRDLVETVTDQLDGYDIAGACESVRQYLDALTNWYVRTQRDRFWEEDADAFDTLYTALEVLCRVMAPLAPLTTEEVWRGLTGGRSVHLADWPSLGAPESSPIGCAEDAILVADDVLVAAVESARAVVSQTLALRKANKLRVRQPLRSLVVAVPDPDGVAPHLDLLASELNLKSVELVAFSPEVASSYGITERLAVNAGAAGPRLGKGVQAVIKASKAGAWTKRAGDDGSERVVVRTDDGEVELLASEYELATVVGEGAGADVAAAVLAGGGFVVLDLALDDDLRAEGYARDVIRDVQEARKAAGLHVTDRIALTLEVPGEWVDAVRAHEGLVAGETLADTVSVSANDGADRTVSVQKSA
ncbi:isoleucine--tRNA ligase [Myceligenerans pegani]|uniref:Isoleucine--tRNA ligase n=1 Tax=Myceligenerans pegani TaxID=2776917 RepID=A0ABR9MXX7_9MICO|nr:isoleucine--tRNA ligase [Myceligenerans sp. TRM 65318]MBE1876254.1 isoleucine--tRNA ligase [Myceligenerans sp. TRM 65318]MBE3018525.1 isoleucine--tRNA ligase [Myceligenerans sp. TRM 65318]